MCSQQHTKMSICASKTSHVLVTHPIMPWRETAYTCLSFSTIFYCRLHFIVHDLRGLASIYLFQDAFLFVVVYQRSSLLPKSLQSLLHGLCIIIATMNQGLPRDVILPCYFRRIEFYVIRPTRGGMDQTASDTPDKETVINDE
mmetsp:Transcript_21888/g.36244  ORF Transcript_21888/g.36244 Transcript_21888/m.36244 type:complete len:143 (+) Transcript_21888:70-498(+)